MKRCHVQKKAPDTGSPVNRYELQGRRKEKREKDQKPLLLKKAKSGHGRCEEKPLVIVGRGSKRRSAKS